MTNKIEVIENDSDEAERADAVVCIRLTSPLMMPDNVIDLCSRCGEAIQHRPSAPKRPPKVCDVCIGPLIDASAAKGEDFRSIFSRRARISRSASLSKPVPTRPQ